MMNANVNCVNKLKSLIYENMNMNRGSHGKVNFLSYFFVLYAYKVQYPLSFVNSGNIFKAEMVLNDFRVSEGGLLGDLHRMALKESSSDDYRFQDVAYLFTELTRFDYSLYLNAYKDIIEFLIETMAMSGRKMEGEIVQPMEITDVICHILNRHRSHHIYNPFSGLASYAIGLKNSNHCRSYLGQELNERAVLLSRLRLDAHYISFPATVEQSDVFHSWGKEDVEFDTVVATPPFGQRIHDISISLFPNRMHHSRTMEEYTLWSCLDDTTGCKTAVVIVPSSFLYRKDTFSLRKTICEKKALEMVIDLPKNIFYGTGISASILVLNLANRQDYVTFINAQQAFTGKNRDLRLDVDRVIDMIEGHDSENRVMTHVSNLFDYDCLFSAYIYANEVVRLEENEHAVSLGDLITETYGESYTGVKPCRTLSIENFSTDFFKVIEAEDVSTCRFEESHITKIHGPHIVLTNMDGKIGVYLHRGDTDFFIKSNHHLALKVNTQLVTPEYMAYMLLTSDWAKKISSYDMGPRISVRNFVRLSSVQVPILFLEDQKQFIRTKLSDYHQEQVRIKKADLERLGFRDVYSDVIHMLGTPFHKQGQVISLLERTSKDDEKYPQRVKALMDISMYIQRIIDIVGKDFSSTEADLDTLDLSDFIIEYHSAWNNYASGVYRMRIEIDADGSPMTIEADKDLLMVLMDTLTDNAKRHGFAPEYNPNNLVNISLQHVVFNEIPCVLLSVSNNGYPLKEGFTIQDYITRGRFEGKNGRTGLGGNHVHTIVKKHGGWLNIRSDKSWNFIVDMLFPMVNFANDDFNDYDYEAI